AGKRTDVDLAAARLLRLVGEEAAVRREDGLRLRELGAQEGIRLAISFERQHPDVVAGGRRDVAQSEEPPIGRPAARNRDGGAREQQLLLAGTVGPLAVDT